MKNNKIILVLCLFILLLSLNAISAQTHNDTRGDNDIQKVNNKGLNNNLKQAQAVYVDTNSVSDVEDGSKSNPYKSITNENLETMESNTTIHVARGTYKLKSINITKDVTIIGDNQKEVIFTSDEINSIFTIHGGVTLLLKDLTIRDFSSPINASVTNYGNLEIENMYLYNNVGSSRDSQGGSILNYANLGVSNTTFEKNMASWGAAIYNSGHARIKNSSFTDNNIFNVGGAIYSKYGNLSVSDSVFTENRAVSGAAIYNAAGYLDVNNSHFLENDAEQFFGGAIYSTGTVITRNSLFDSNHANKDGGAITNTNNFTIINCTFTENFANENGGVIENVPWGSNQNGNLTIINSSFIENTATLGGVIINYDKEEYLGESATVTARNCLFDSNTADKGGVIYNEQYVDMEYNVFVDNKAKDANVIYTVNDTLIKSLDSNWWATNNPSLEDIGFMPQKWVVMNFTNTTELSKYKTAKIRVSLNTLNNGEMVSEKLPERIVNFNSVNSIFNEYSMNIRGNVENTVKYKGDNISAVIDNQVLSLHSVTEPKANIITVNPINNSYYKDMIEIRGKFTDINHRALINTLLNCKVNNKIINVKTDNKGEYSITYLAKRVGTNNLTVSYKGSSVCLANSTSTSFNINRKMVKIVLDPIANVKFKEDNTISGKFTDIGGHALLNTNLKLKINDQTFTVNTGDDGRFAYRIKATNIGNNKVTASFAGNSNYGKNSTTLSFNVNKKGVKFVLDSIRAVNFKENVSVTGRFTDSNGHALMNTNLKLNIYGRDVIVNTGRTGVFTYMFKATKTGNNRVTVMFIGNSHYLSNSSSINFTTKKQDLRISVDKIKQVILGRTVKVSGKLTDKHNHPLMNSNIKIKVNAKSVNVRTDKMGLFAYNVTASHVGTNLVTLMHVGNSNYNSYVTNTTFVVKN